MRWSTPAAGLGTSVSTLSVDTSSRGSSTSIESPSCLSQRVTVPSETLSPRAGMVTENGKGCLRVSTLRIQLGEFSDNVVERALWNGGSAVHVKRLAGESKVGLAERLRLRRVRVDELRDLAGQRLPVVDE